MLALGRVPAQGKSWRNNDKPGYKRSAHALGTRESAMSTTEAWMRKPVKLVVAPALLLAIMAALLLSCSRSPVSLPGVVLERNSDPRKRSPIAGVEVTASTASMGSTSTSGQTDSSGY